MANVTVIGAQWGDEGKGKVVDYLAATFDIIARYQGGHNAGHTVVVDGRYLTAPSLTLKGNEVDFVRYFQVLDHVIALARKTRGAG